MTEVIPVGLVGFGFSGRTFHAPVIASVPGLRLAAIVQRSGTDARELYPDTKVVSTLAELLEDKHISVIAIATPNDSHFDLARQGLLAGRHVVIDKPFAANSAEAAELVNIARERERLLTVYHNRRWDGDFLTVRRLLSAGSLGRVTSFRSSFDRFRPGLKPGAWRERAEPGSGVLLDLGSHLMDQALLLFGVPSSIYADVRAERAGALADDAFDLHLRYPGLHVQLSATMLAAIPSPRFAVHGTKGSFLKHGLDPQEDQLKRGLTPGHVEWGEEPETSWGELSLLEENGLRISRLKTERGDYRAFYEGVRESIAEKAAPPVTPEDAYRVMKILDLAKESSAQQQVLTVSFGE